MQSQQQENQILYLKRQDVEHLCQEIDSVEVMREVFRLHGSEQTILPDEAYLGWDNHLNERVRSLNMPAYVGGAWQSAGTKIINGNPQNPTRGVPRASGLTVLFENSTVRPCCIMEGAHISSLRTASVSALAVDLLQGRPIEDLAIIGAGVLAQAHVSLLAQRLPTLKRIWAFDLMPERVAILKQELSTLLEKHGLIFHLCKNAEEAIRAAQVIIPTTTTTEGYIHFAWLQAGALLVNISLDDPLPEVVLQATQVIVDDWHLVKEDPRRLIGRMYRAGQVIAPDDPTPIVQKQTRRIDAQLGEIVSGKKDGRRHIDDIILVNPFGLAIEDIALATEVYRKAQQQNLGLLLDV